MITDPRPWLIALPLVALGWIGTLALIMLLGGENLVATLYALGAPLVLPAGLTGWLPQTG